MKIVFLLEELSMKYLLDGILPKILPDGVLFQTIPHNGKSALKRSLPRKIRGWNEPDVRFVVVCDQDTADCIELKKQLMVLCNKDGQQVMIRIVCHELEAWYFGDMEAIVTAYGDRRISEIANKKQYRIPDSIPNPKEVLRRILPEHQQIAGAMKIAPHMDIENNTSASFNCFVSGVKRIASGGTLVSNQTVTN